MSDIRAGFVWRSTLDELYKLSVTGDHEFVSYRDTTDGSERLASRWRNEITIHRRLQMMTCYELNTGTFAGRTMANYYSS